METKGLKINISKTKVMISGKNCDDVEKIGNWLCALCWKGVKSNSVQCTGCGERVHKCCSGLKGLSSTTLETFVCKVCERASDGKNINIQETWIW